MTVVKTHYHRPAVAKAPRSKVARDERGEGVISAAMAPRSWRWRVGQPG